MGDLLHDRRFGQPTCRFCPGVNRRPLPAGLAAHGGLGLGEGEQRVARDTAAAMSPHADGSWHHVEPVSDLADAHHVQSHDLSVTHSVTASKETRGSWCQS